MSYRYATPVRILQRLITAPEFAELWAEEKLEPRGEGRADLRMGILAATVASGAMGNRRSWKPADFIPTFQRRPRRQTPAEMRRELVKLTLALGGKVPERILAMEK